MKGSLASRFSIKCLEWRGTRGLCHRVCQTSEQKYTQRVSDREFFFVLFFPPCNYPLEFCENRSESIWGRKAQIREKHSPRRISSRPSSRPDS